MTKIEALRTSIAAVLALALAMGCSGDDGGNAGPSGRGTPTCNDWQAAVCEWLVKCPVTGAASCDQVKGIACKSDPEAARCAGALRSASCTTPPSRCDLSDLADRAPALKACNDYKETACTRLDECKTITHDECLQQLMGLDCSRAVGVMLGYEQCITEMKSLACGSMMVPAVCNGVILLQ
jgi:hypothetical protein